MKLLKGARIPGQGYAPIRVEQLQGGAAPGGVRGEGPWGVAEAPN